MHTLSPVEKNKKVLDFCLLCKKNELERERERERERLNPLPYRSVKIDVV